MINFLTNLNPIILTGNIQNPTIRKIAEKLVALQGDIRGLASVIAGLALAYTFINYFMLGGDSKDGIKRVKTILIAYGCIMGISFILTFIDELVA